MTAADAYRWVKRAPAERATLPAAAVVWAASDILHADHVSAALMTGGVALAAGISYGKIKDPRYRRQAATTIAVIGGWLTAVAHFGVGAGPYHLLSCVYGAGSFIGYLALRRHEKVRAAREWRKAKAEWYGRASRYGINQSHLLDYEQTWLGESLLVDVRGTGQPASSYIHGRLAETIASEEMLPDSRVRVTKGGIAGRIRISIRYSDPWKHPLPHPAVEAVDGFDLPVPCTIREPLCVGYDPENGTPLRVSLWNAEGAKRVLVVGMQGAGKSALLSCLRERITAADDAVLWDINVSKAREDESWAPACDLAAVGDEERERALRILLLARHTITWRSRQKRTTGDFHPDSVHPLIVVMIDEIDELVKGGDHLAAAIKKELTHLTTKGRGEGVALVVAGQRGTVDWLGGADIRTQFNRFIIGKVSRLSEVNNAVGEYSAMLPNMAEYGEDQAGVWAIGASGVAPQVGRSFKLTEPADLELLARVRAGWQGQLEAGLLAHLGDHYWSLKDDRGAMGHPARGPAWAAPGAGGPPDGTAPGSSRTATAVIDDASSLERLGREMTEGLSPELQEQLRRMDTSAMEARRIGQETDAAAAGLPEVPPEKLAEAAAARWNQGAELTGPVPPPVEAQILAMIGEDGASGRSIAEAFKPDITEHTTRNWLNRMRYEGKIYLTPAGRASKWRPGPDPDAGSDSPAAGTDGGGQ
jgi:hypothetical protein